MCDEPHDNCESHECECCKFGPEEMERREQKAMRQYGWFSHIVPEDPDSPLNFNAHTHGFGVTFDQPDVQIVLPLPQKVLGHVLHSLADKIRDEDYKMETGVPVEGILHGNYKVMFVKAVECDRQVFRMILPDKDGNLEQSEQQEGFADQWVGSGDYREN